MADDEKLVELARKVASPAGEAKYHKPIGTLLGGGSNLAGGVNPSRLRPARGVVHEVGKSLAQQHSDFSTKHLPVGSRISGLRNGRTETFVKQKDGSWKHSSGISLSDEHFNKFSNKYRLAHVPTSAAPIDKTKRHVTKARAGLYHAAAKLGEADMESALTKKDMIEHFAHTYLLGGHVGASDSALDRVVKLSQKNSHMDMISSASDADLAKAYKLAEKDAETKKGVEQTAAEELCAKIKAEIMRRKSGK